MMKTTSVQFALLATILICNILLLAPAPRGKKDIAQTTPWERLSRKPLRAIQPGARHRGQAAAHANRQAFPKRGDGARQNAQREAATIVRTSRPASSAQREPNRVNATSGRERKGLRDKCTDGFAPRQNQDIPVDFAGNGIPPRKMRFASSTSHGNRLLRKTETGLRNSKEDGGIGATDDADTATQNMPNLRLQQTAAFTNDDTVRMHIRVCPVNDTNDAPPEVIVQLPLDGAWAVSQDSGRHPRTSSPGCVKWLLTPEPTENEQTLDIVLAAATDIPHDIPTADALCLNSRGELQSIPGSKPEWIQGSR